jgi:CO/xanthine dehydrogenase FAD-binding subunit
MKPVDFRYARPATLADAVTALQSDVDAKVIAGGQSLGPLLNMRLFRPALLVDINAIPDFRCIEETAATVRIGATVRQREAERSDVIARRLPLMRDALPSVGHAHTRNRGTVVGSIVHADPAAELPLVALCLDAVLELAGPNGARDVDVANFYLGYLTTDLAREEIAVAVRFPVPALADGVRRGTAFVEMARREGDFAIVAAAAQLDYHAASQRVVDARLGLTGIGGAPFRFHAGEALVRDAADPHAAFASVGRAAAEAIDPDSDLHATAGYRRAVAATLLGRALDAAFTSARVPDPRA